MEKGIRIKFVWDDFFDYWSSWYWILLLSIGSVNKHAGEKERGAHAMKYVFLVRMPTDDERLETIEN